MVSRLNEIEDFIGADNVCGAMFVAFPYNRILMKHFSYPEALNYLAKEITNIEIEETRAVCQSGRQSASQMTTHLCNTAIPGR